MIESAINIPTSARWRARPKEARYLRVVLPGPMIEAKLTRISITMFWIRLRPLIPSGQSAEEERVLAGRPSGLGEWLDRRYAFPRAGYPVSPPLPASTSEIPSNSNGRLKTSLQHAA